MESGRASLASCQFLDW